MKIPTIYSGPDGESHFGEVEVSIDGLGKDVPEGGKGPIKVTELHFRNIESTGRLGEVSTYHTAPRRQLLFFLHGEVDFAVSSGEKLRRKAGDLMLAEDLTGKGHYSIRLSPDLKWVTAWLDPDQEF